MKRRRRSAMGVRAAAFLATVHLAVVGRAQDRETDSGMAPPPQETEDDAGARGDAEALTCQQAYEDAQIRRRDGKLIEAREQLRICGGEMCPAILRTDCVEWLLQVNTDMPSVVLEAQTDAGTVFDVTATVDGKLVASQLDGRPIEIDPGLHAFVFRRAQASVIEQRLIVRVGEKSRLVVADWTTSKRSEILPQTRVDRPVPTSVVWTGGAGVLGLAGFAVAGGIGNAVKASLDASGCAPFCARDRVDQMRTAYLVADVGLGIGVVQVVTSLLLFLTRPAVDTGSRLVPAHAGIWTPCGAESRSLGSLCVAF